MAAAYKISNDIPVQYECCVFEGITAKETREMFQNWLNEFEQTADHIGRK